MAPVTAIMDAIYLLFSAMDNNILHASCHYTADKTEDRINFSLSHERLYLFGSDDERYDKSATANKFDIYCGGGRSIS